MHLKSTLNENNSLAKNKHVQLNGLNIGGGNIGGAKYRGSEEEEKKRGL